LVRQVFRIASYTLYLAQQIKIRMVKYGSRPHFDIPLSLGRRASQVVSPSDLPDSPGEPASCTPPPKPEEKHSQFQQITTQQQFMQHKMAQQQRQLQQQQQQQQYSQQYQQHSQQQGSLQQQRKVKTEYISIVELKSTNA